MHANNLFLVRQPEHRVKQRDGLSCGVGVGGGGGGHIYMDIDKERFEKKTVLKEGCSRLRGSFCLVFVLVLHCCLQEIWVALPGYGTAAARAALPVPISVCSFFVCLNNGMAANV